MPMKSTSLIKKPKSISYILFVSSNCHPISKCFLGAQKPKFNFRLFRIYSLRGKYYSIGLIHILINVNHNQNPRPSIQAKSNPCSRHLNPINSLLSNNHILNFHRIFFFSPPTYNGSRSTGYP
jgi:hypothetical protein